MPQADHAESPGFGPPALALLLAAGFFAVVYPLAIDFVVERFGTRTTSCALLAIAALAWIPALRADASAHAADGQGPGRSRLASFGFLVSLVAAALLDDRSFLRLLPAWVYFGMALYCFASARSEHSIIEQGVRWMIPEAPDFIRDYCRVLTGLWSGFFLSTAALIAVFAFTLPPERWRSLMGRDVWLAMGAVMAVEFFVRKTWFRYYFRNGPFERFWAQLFPAEATARGRRSLEYIEAYHERIAREAASRDEEQRR